MAFKNVNEFQKFAKFTDLAVGDSVTGYAMAVTESSKIEGAMNLLMKVGEESISYSVAGNIKYVIRDGKLLLGALTRITRQEDTKVKGKKATRFLIEQDAENMLAGFNATSAAPTTSSVQDKLKSLRG